MLAPIISVSVIQVAVVAVVVVLVEVVGKISYTLSRGEKTSRLYLIKKQ